MMRRASKFQKKQKKRNVAVFINRKGSSSSSSSSSSSDSECERRYSVVYLLYWYKKVQTLTLRTHI
jgi:hypothetical protein